MNSNKREKCVNNPLQGSEVADNKKNILIYAHYYYPDTASTGQVLQELAEGMTDDFNITVICVVPSYLGTIEDKYKTQKFYCEELNGVKIVRVRVSEFDKTKGRSMNYIILFAFDENKTEVITIKRRVGMLTEVVGMSVKFTVVTVVFNAEKVLCKTIDSVLNQEYVPYEYLIIDGLSKDDTVKIAESYKEAFQLKGIKYKIISEKDTGIYNAMNKGIRAATGDFISFLNAGDWYELNALKNVNAFYEAEPFDLTYGGLNYINPNGSVIIKMSKLDKFPVSSRYWNHPSMFLKNEIYKEYGFDEKFKAYADFNLYIKLRKKSKMPDGPKIRVINKVITNFVADGVSTNVEMKRVLARSKEKYDAYRSNGYGKIYWLESYGWEILKSLYFRLKR